MAPKKQLCDCRDGLLTSEQIEAELHHPDYLML
jgi:hypothetical protein